MMIANAIQRMIAHCEGSQHDIQHFLKVYAYARTIGLQEGLAPDVQQRLELAAIVHDIACRMCREKYCSTKPEYQEPEGAKMARPFLAALGLPEAEIDRLCYMVGHHHSRDYVDGPDFQVLMEADFLVNAADHGLSQDKIRQMETDLFRTQSGKALLREMYLRQAPQA